MAEHPVDDAHARAFTDALLERLGVDRAHVKFGGVHVSGNPDGGAFVDITFVLAEDEVHDLFNAAAADFGTQIAGGDRG